MSMSLLWFPRRIVAGAGTITGGDRSTVMHASGTFAGVGVADYSPPEVAEGGDTAAVISGGDRRTDDD